MRKLINRMFLSAVFLLVACTVFSQTSVTVSGTVKNSKTKEGVPAVSIMVKGASAGDYTDDNGKFKFTTTQKLPFTLIISSIGFSPKEVEITSSGQVVDVELDVAYAVGQEIVVAASRVPERILEAPVSIERVNSTAIRNAPGPNYYDVLGTLKGVDVTTSSYTFKTVSTRGFNGSGNLRFNQLVDGMDNAAPALNFSVGNVIGLTELDVDNMELLSGASSALYGSGGMNGTLLISSKDPFKYQGVSFQVKQGIMHVGDSRHSASPFYNWSLRWGKKVSDHFAFKFGAEYIKADDWEANDETNLLRNNVDSKIISGDRQSDPNYDGVNVYGDEVSAGMKSFSQIAVLTAGLPQSAIDFLNSLLMVPEYDYATIKSIVTTNAPQLLPILPFYVGYVGPNFGRPDIYGTQAVSRTGYAEKDLVNYNSYNVKFSGGLYFKLGGSTEASLTGNWGLGTSVYTGADRYSLKNFVIGQYRLEFKNKNWFLRAYTTQENSGDSYASTLTAIAINNAWKTNKDWFAGYDYVYSDAVLSGASPQAAHTLARGYADQGRYLPGSPEYNAAFNKSVTTSISDGGSQFADKSDLYQFEGQLNLSQYTSKVVDVLIGASYRWYNLNSQGTIFADTAGAIKIGEFGTYIQLQKALFNDVLKLSASGRYDKNENFDGRFTPRFTASIKVAKDNNIRLSYQQAYRFPDNQDQWINLKSPGSILIGCLPGFNDYYHFSTNPVYTSESVVAYRSTGDPTKLVVAAFGKAKPETMESFEIGYRGVVSKKLLIDAYYYFSKYKDFLGRQAVARGDGTFGNSIVELSSPFTTQNFSFVYNSPTPVKANGWGIGGDYLAGGGYHISANVYGDQLKNVPTGLITFFNTPKTRFNLGFGNADLYHGLGFNIAYKWQAKVAWEGTFGSGTIPAFGALDAQISYKWKQPKILFKLGGTNITNHYYRNAFGNPYIGALYYVSIGYNMF